MKSEQWLKSMGVDEMIGEAPVDRLTSPSPLGGEGRDGGAIRATTSHPSPPPQGGRELYETASRTFTAAPGVVSAARPLADAAAALDDLYTAIRNFDGCALKKTATKTVIADGNPKAKVMVIGEAPGANEDEQGIPFCGQSGQLLDKVLATICLKRAENFYITNTIFWRPPGNRPPTTEELEMCKPFVEKHIALIDPALIILAGGSACKAVLGQEVSISKLRGKFHRYTNPYLTREIPVGVTFHPSYLLRSPGQKRLAWVDMLMFQDKLQELKVL